MKAKGLRKGMKIKDGDGYKKINQATERGNYMWVEYTCYDSIGHRHGSFAESFPLDQEVTRVY